MGEDVIHFDGDIVFNENHHVLENKMHGKTFVLQGCPALTVISNPNWYAQYKHHLDMFVSDITVYSTKAWELRIEGEEAERNWVGLRDRKIISSDQDLLRHLIHTGATHKDSVDSILNRLNGYIIFENPLFIEA